MDLNADLGESYGRWTLGDDDAMLDIVTSANIACGFHAGDPRVLARTCAAAAARGVAIGAHVSYPDLPGFGRRAMDLDPDDLAADVTYQIGALDGFARIAGTRVGYVKPHGALYNTVAHDERQARAVVDAVARYDEGLALLGLPESALLAVAAQRGVRGVPEFFADRGYTPAGTLVSRSVPGAVLIDPGEVAARVVRLAAEGVVAALDEDGRAVDIPVSAESVCVHGDSPGAVQMAHAVRLAMTRAGAPPAAFTERRSPR